VSLKADQKSRTRAAILASSAKLLRERGIVGARVADVMAGAGLTVGGFYAHWPSKEALVDETLASTAEGMRERLFARLEDKPAADRAEVVVKRYLTELHHRRRPGAREDVRTRVRSAARLAARPARAPATSSTPFVVTRRSSSPAPARARDAQRLRSRAGRRRRRRRRVAGGRAGIANVARNAVLDAGWPLEVSGVSLNRFCGSGVQAVNFAAMGVASGAPGPRRRRRRREHVARADGLGRRRPDGGNLAPPRARLPGAAGHQRRPHRHARGLHARELDAFALARTTRPRARSWREALRARASSPVRRPRPASGPARPRRAPAPRHDPEGLAQAQALVRRAGRASGGPERRDARSARARAYPQARPDPAPPHRRQLERHRRTARPRCCSPPSAT
jgi:AcrR family transcriptional regulator